MGGNLNNKNLKNIIKSAINLSVQENREIIPLLQKSFQIIEINEKKKELKLKKKKEKILKDTLESASNKIKIINRLIEKESEIFGKKTQDNYEANDQMLYD